MVKLCGRGIQPAGCLHIWVQRPGCRYGNCERIAVEATDGYEKELQHPLFLPLETLVIFGQERIALLPPSLMFEARLDPQKVAVRLGLGLWMCFPSDYEAICRLSQVSTKALFPFLSSSNQLALVANISLTQTPFIATSTSTISITQSSYVATSPLNDSQTAPLHNIPAPRSHSS